MESHLTALTAYFSAHPQLALGAVFAASLLESLAVIGTIVPGSAIVFAGGMLIGLGQLDPWWAAAMAVSGAVMGDGVSYWLGHHFQDSIRTVWPLNKFPALFERGQLYFEKNGGKSVFLGRFLGSVRAIVPVVAGMTGMPATQFYAMNLLSALAWAAAHLLPGLLFGASLQLAGAVSSRLVVVLLIIAVIFWTLSKLVQFAYHQVWPRVKLLRDRTVAQAHQKPGPFASVVLSLLDPARAESPALLTAALLLMGGAWLFLGIVEDVISNDPLIQFDQLIYAALQGLRTAWGDRLMVAVTEAGGAVGTIFLIAGVSLLLAIKRRWRTLGYWLAAIGMAEIFVVLLKYTLERARPHNIYTGLAQFSFPSGHATSSIVAYGFLAFFGVAREIGPGQDGHHAAGRCRHHLDCVFPPLPGRALVFRRVGRHEPGPGLGGVAQHCLHASCGPRADGSMAAVAGGPGNAGADGRLLCRRSLPRRGRAVCLSAGLANRAP